MSPLLKSLLRFAVGTAILLAGLMVTKGLIGMKPEAPISTRPVQPRPVKAMPFEPGWVEPLTPVEGRVDALHRMDLFAEVNGVLSIGGKEFREGTRYREGEVVLQLDDREARAALVAQRSQFLQLLSSSSADLRLDYAEAWPRWKNYLQALNVAETTPQLPEPSSERERLFLANRGIMSAFYSIRSAEERLSKYTVHAPFNGTLTAASVTPGALVRAGQPLGTFVGEDEFEVKTAVHARYLERIKVSDVAEFMEASGNLVASGRVVRIASNVDPSTQSASVFCQVRPLDGDATVLRDGRYLSGTLRSAGIGESMAIRLDLISEKGTVFIISDDQLVEREVNVAFRAIDEAVITGLDPGTLLLAEPVSGAYAGMSVKVAE